MSQHPMGQFLEACRATGPIELVVEDAPGAVLGRWTLPQPFALVGRDAKAELSLDDETVSQRHAYMQVIDGRAFCLDLGSRCGITWGRIVQPSGWLTPGEAVGIGPYRVRLEAGVADLAQSPETGMPNPLTTTSGSTRPAEAGAPLPPVALEVIRRSDRPSTWRVRSVLTLVGRATECRLQIQDNSISRFHCALIRTPGGVWVVDLLSREGIRVNGARARWSRLNDGDHLHIGRYHLVVWSGDSAVARHGTGSGSSSGIHAAILPSLPRDHVPAVRTGAAPPARPAATNPLPVNQLLRGRPPEQIELAEALLQPLVQQFGQMQQQMFDQFHQAMLAMFQMFGSMHRDQMVGIREELERIRQLGQELEALQARAAPADAAPADAAGASTAPVPTPQGRPPEAAPGPAVTSGATGEPLARPAAKRNPAPPPDSPKAPPSVAPNLAGEPLHARLFERMAEIQNERQSRWQRIVQLLTGGGIPAP